MLNGPQYKFAAGVATGLSALDAYQAAYPNAGAESARRSASELMTNHDVLKEIERIRGQADSVAGEAVLSIIEKRKFFARLVRACIANLPDDSDLWQEISITENGVKRKLPDKLRAIASDNDLASEGAQAGADDAISILLAQLTGAKSALILNRKPWNGGESSRASRGVTVPMVNGSRPSSKTTHWPGTDAGRRCVAWSPGAAEAIQ